MDNQTILQKADLALSDLTSSGGILVDAQAQKFIRLLIKESRIMQLATVVPMRAQKQLIEKTRFGSRVLRAGAEATALPAGDRAKPDLSKVELDAKLFKAEVRLDNEVLEDSIEQGQLKQTVMEMMGDAISRDMDEVIVQGDTASSDTFLAQFDGMIKAATSNVVVAGGVNLHKGVLRDCLKTMPSEYLRNKAMMRYLTSVDAEIDYRDSISDRATQSGDDALKNAAPVGYSGIPVVDVPMFPENLGGSNNETDVIFTDPKNIQVGVWRKITIETDKDISQGVMIIVASLRFDFKYAQELAVVKATGVKVSG